MSSLASALANGRGKANFSCCLKLGMDDFNVSSDLVSAMLSFGI